MSEKVLSIVVPCYDECQHEVKPLLNSIVGQVGVNFEEIEIILVNDGYEETPLEDELFLNQYRPMVDIYFERRTSNNGPGVTRQAGLDRAEGDYVMFCDADDTLFGALVLARFLDTLKTEKPDVLSSPWYEELKGEDGQYTYVLHEDEATWMHGKAFRRAFLQSNNIRFHKDFQIHEDSYILSIIYAMINNARKATYPTYIWKWRDGSIVRKNDSSYTYDSLPTFIHAVTESIQDLENRGLTQVLPFKVGQLICYIFFNIHQAHWAGQEEYKRAAEIAIQDLLKRFGKYLEQMSLEDKQKLYCSERARHFSNEVEPILFEDWLNKVQSLE